MKEIKTAKEIVILLHAKEVTNQLAVLYAYILVVVAELHLLERSISFIF
jgi:hypothetical protein